MDSISPETHQQLQQMAAAARGAILKTTTLAGSGHPGGSMSSIDILLSLYEIARINPQNISDERRDRVVISNGHISPGVYTALGMNNFFSLDEFISQFRLAGSIFEGHVERDVPGVEWGSGNLGQGLSAACGFALASRLKKIDNYIYVLMGDGEQQKGQISEARRFAVKYKLHNLTVFIDYNRLQITGDINFVMPQQIKENFISDNWHVLEIDGHSFEQIFEAINKAAKIDKPVAVIAHTVMGKGVSFMENDEKYHGAALKEEQLNNALTQLKQQNDLQKFKEMRRDYAAALQKQERTAPAIDSPDFDLQTGNPFIYEDKLDNRSAWGNALADIAKLNKKEPYTPLAVFDCDLQGSVKTKDFAEILPDNFFECGISEHHTATTSGSISIENIQTFFADFGIFGVDETFNQHRLNDINNTNLKLIVTHVGVDVGEDGKTHHCLNYVGVMRNLYNFKIIVPVCPNQTDRIIRYVAAKRGNYLVAMGRSKIPVLRNEDGSLCYGKDYQFRYGRAELLRDGSDGALLVMGTLSSNAVKVVEMLRDKGIRLQLWAVSCPADIDKDTLLKAAQTGVIFTYEDHNVNTGLGSCVSDALHKFDINCRLHKFGIERYCCSGKSADIYRLTGLDAETIHNKIAKIFGS